ncbi:MAG: hypothetical protein Q4B73_03505 [Lachnospiraceae bacterium]|nr:hypothetical protein [Lachnospiraceae bacterium]
MKKGLLIIGIILIIAGCLALLFAGLSQMAFNGLMDGSGALYARLHSRMLIHLIGGLVLAVAGIVCLIVRARR